MTTQFTAPKMTPRKTHTPNLSERELKELFIQNTSLTSIIEPHGIYSKDGYIERDRSPLNSLTFLIADELGYDSSAIVHWNIGQDEQGLDSLTATQQDITRFNTAFEYSSHALRWPNSGITDCLMRGTPRDTETPVHDQLGLLFNPEKKIGKGKKRMHIFGLAEGAFLCSKPSTNDQILHITDDVSLTWQLEEHVVNDTNDGGGSIRRSAAQKLMVNSNIPIHADTMDKIDAVQIVILTTETIIKGIFVVVDDNKLHTDILVPEPSLVYEITCSKYTMGKINTLRRKKHKNTTTMEPLQVVPNYLSFVDYKEVTNETFRACIQQELDAYQNIVKEPIIDFYDSIQNDLHQLPFQFQLDELSANVTTDNTRVREFIKTTSAAAGNSPYCNPIVMSQTMSGTYRHFKHLVDHWRGMPGIVISGGRHYITYAPHCAEENPPVGYMGFIYWNDKCKTCGSTTCHEHFQRDIRRITINPVDCDDRVRDLLDGFDMDDSCFWTLLRDETGTLKVWIGRNPMSPYRGVLLNILPKDEEYLMANGYRALTQTGTWEHPDLWEIPETLKLGELQTKPEWTWDDEQDLEQCFILSEKTGGLGQLALYIAAFQYTGQWDVEKHHILNSNVVDAQVNADKDIEATVTVMHKYFMDTFVTNKKPMNNYIVKRISPMLSGADINPEIDFNIGSSPKLDFMAKGINFTHTMLEIRDRIRNLTANGPTTRLLQTYDPALIGIVLALAQQIRHIWTEHREMVRQLDAALSTQEVTYEQYTQKVKSHRQHSTELIAELSVGHYSSAIQLPYYNVGEFAGAWTQIQATRATRFTLFENEKYPQPISMTPLTYLPAEEQISGFYDMYTRPTWIARMIPTDNIPDDTVCTVHEDTTGVLFLADGTGQILGTLLEDARALVGETIQFKGYVPRHHNWSADNIENWDAMENCAVFYVNDTIWKNKLT